MLIPRRAVREVGQLELVDVVNHNQTSRRTIRTGRALSDDEIKMFPDLLQGEQYVIVLSGLHEGEQVVLPAAAAQETPHD